MCRHAGLRSASRLDKWPKPPTRDALAPLIVCLSCGSCRGTSANVFFHHGWRLLGLIDCARGSIDSLEVDATWTRVPANLYLTKRADRNELVKILDVDIAKLRKSEEQSGTATGQAMRTPYQAVRTLEASGQWHRARRFDPSLDSCGHETNGENRRSCTRRKSAREGSRADQCTPAGFGATSSNASSQHH